MPHTVIKLDNEPIILTHIIGELNPAVYFDITLKAADLIENIPGTIYRITDVTKARIALLDMVDMVVQVLKGWPGTVSDPRVVSLVVTRGGNASLAAKHLARFAPQSIRVRTFSSLADALAFARAEIAAQPVIAPGANVWMGLRSMKFRR